MEQRDYILREIEKIGQMLLGILGKLRMQREDQEYAYGLTMADQEFEEETGITFSLLAGMNPSSLTAFFKNHPELQGENTELVADLIIEIAEQQKDETAKYLQLAIRLLHMIDERDRTFSLERAEKLTYLTERLSKIG